MVELCELVMAEAAKTEKLRVVLMAEAAKTRARVEELAAFHVSQESGALKVAAPNAAGRFEVGTVLCPLVPSE